MKKKALGELGVISNSKLKFILIKKEKSLLTKFNYLIIRPIDFSSRLFCAK